MSNRWRLLFHDDVGAAEGLALDEALMGDYRRGAPSRPPTLRLYNYRSHAALVGRYQHLDAEVDLDACERTGTPVSRRPTGGGAIVMGTGQLGVAVVDTAPAAESPKELIERYSRGVAAGLAELGIETSFRGKNDLEAGGRKIAGLGLYLDGEGALLFHASVLADLDVAFMLEVLRIPAAKLGDKGVAAVADRVTTVSRETGRPWTAAQLRPLVATGFAKALGADPVEGSVTAGEEARAGQLARGKYADPAWLHQRSPHPDATGTAVVKTSEGLVRLYLTLSGFTIKSALFTGDFNDLPVPLVAFEESLRWKSLDPEKLRSLARLTAGESTLGVTPEKLADLVLEAAGRAQARAGAAPVRPEGSCYFPESPATSRRVPA